jgi:hypothetical protein
MVDFREQSARDGDRHIGSRLPELFSRHGFGLIKQDCIPVNSKTIGWILGGVCLAPSSCQVLIAPNVDRKRILESAAGTLKPITRELEGNDARAFADADAEKIGLFGTIVLFSVNWKPGRWGLAGTLFEILSFQPGSDWL